MIASDGGDNSGCAICRRSHHAASGGVLFIDCHGERVHPVHGCERIGRGPAAKLLKQSRSATAHFETTGKNALGSQTAIDAGFHRCMNLTEPPAYLRIRSPGFFVLQSNSQIDNPVSSPMRRRSAALENGNGTSFFADVADC